MRRRLVACVLATLAAALCACQSQGPTSNPAASAASNTAAPASTTAAADPKVVEEIRAVLERHDKALGDKNLESLMETFASAPNTVVLGTGPGERWVGAEDIRGAYTQIFKDYDPGTLNVTCDWKTGNGDSTVAWLAATCQAKDSLKGQTREYPLNISASMTKQDGKWRFTMLHMSNPTSPPPPDSTAK